MGFSLFNQVPRLLFERKICILQCHGENANFGTNRCSSAASLLEKPRRMKFLPPISNYRVSWQVWNWLKMNFTPKIAFLAFLCQLCKMKLASLRNLFQVVIFWVEWVESYIFFSGCLKILCVLSSYHLKRGRKRRRKLARDAESLRQLETKTSQ